jgi:ketosteroid isomerase-like protein
MSNEAELIERTYRAYFTVFQMGDPRALMPYFHVPSVFLSAAGTYALNNLRETEQFFDRLFYALRTRGYARSVLNHVQVKLIADDMALVNARAERFQRDGELLENISALYTMRKAEGTWRIAVVTMYEPARALELA